MFSEIHLTVLNARRVNNPHPYLAFALIILIALTAGCAKQQIPKDRVDPNRLLIADLPTYSPGEFFEYDNGLSMIVTESSNGMVSWKYANGSASSGYANFLVPKLTWEATGSKGTSTTNAAKDFLWPLNFGGFGRYDITQTIHEADGRVPETLGRRWECSVDGSERVSVPAGDFDTYVVSCNRYSSDDNEWRGRHTYYYSPDIRHYVKLEKRYVNRSTRIEQLKSYGFNSEYLPENEQNELKKLLYRTLADGKQGISQGWTSSDGTISGMLIPFQNYRGASGEPCREYKSLYNIQGRVYHHTRKACQAADGSWQRIRF